MAGKFELYKDKSGKFRFRLKASNGQVIATGEAYETKASALNGIDDGADPKMNRRPSTRRGEWGRIGRSGLGRWLGERCVASPVRGLVW